MPTSQRFTVNKLSERGVIAQVLVLLVLIVGIAVGIYLVQRTNIFKSKAARTGTRIEIIDVSGNEIDKTTSKNVKVKLVYIVPSPSPSPSASDSSGITRVFLNTQTPIIAGQKINVGWQNLNPPATDYITVDRIASPLNRGIIFTTTCSTSQDPTTPIGKSLGTCDLQLSTSSVSDYFELRLYSNNVIKAKSEPFYMWATGTTPTSVSPIGVGSSIKGVASDSSQVNSFPTQFRLANSEDQLTNAQAIDFTQNSQIVDWVLTDGIGTKNIYAQFKINGNWADIVSTTIILENASPEVRTIYYPKVLAIGLNPVEGSRNLADTYFSWFMNGKTPTQFEDGILNKMIDDIKQLSGNGINYQIAKKLNISQFPKYINNFQFTIDNYQKCTQPPYTGLPNDLSCESQKWLFDVQSWFKDNNICQVAENSGSDEIWLISPPFLLSYESFMVGPDYGFNVNGSSYTISGCNKHYIIVNPNYGSSDLFLHDFGHRIEATMNYITSIWNSTDRKKYWEDFANVSRYSYPNSPAAASTGCGNAHFPFNASGQYDVSNENNKSFNCSDWKNFPDLKGIRENLNCSAWGCGDDTGWQKYWLGSIPYSPGTVQMIGSSGQTFNFKKDWWHYLLYPENAISFVKNPGASIPSNPSPTPSFTPSTSPSVTPAPSPTGINIKLSGAIALDKTNSAGVNRFTSVSCSGKPFQVASDIKITNSGLGTANWECNDPSFYFGSSKGSVVNLPNSQQALIMIPPSGYKCVWYGLYGDRSNESFDAKTCTIKFTPKNNAEIYVWFYINYKTPPCGTMGDVDLDGFVTTKDSDLIRNNIIAGTYTYQTKYRNADVDGNRTVDINDAYAIDRYVKGLDSTLKVCSLVSTDPATITICKADANKDGTVNGGDISLVNTCFLKKSTDKNTQGQPCLPFDLNLDGVINSADRTVLMQSYQKRIVPAECIGI